MDIADTPMELCKRFKRCSIPWYKTRLEIDMNYDAFFKSSLETLRASGDYRVFANLERHNGNFPHATSLGQDDPQEVPKTRAQMEEYR